MKFSIKFGLCAIPYSIIGWVNILTATSDLGKVVGGYNIGLGIVTSILAILAWRKGD